jgi:hypothetical protein
MAWERIAVVSLKSEPAFGSDAKLFSIAVLTLHWARSVPGLGRDDDICSDDQVSAWLHEWWAANKDNLPGSMDDEIIDSLWFDKETRK